MKLYCYLCAGMVCLSPLVSVATETANATTFCYSLKFQRGIDPDGNYSLDITSLSGSVNGELAPDFLASGYTHSTYLSLQDDLLGETLSGAMVLDVPDGGDANKDGFADFFQVSQGITNLASSGAYDLSLYGSSSMTATWNRPAGSKDGSCTVSMKLMAFQPVTFVFGFELLEYRGPLSYTSGTSNVSGTIHLEQTGNAGSTFDGAIRFAKSATDPFNELTLQPGAWADALQQPVSYADDLFSRDLRWPTNYYGYFELTDTNNPGAFYPYGLWMLSIDDPNDSNRNGIPDFSDEPAAVQLPRQPRIELVQSGDSLVATLHGDIGHVHEIQAAPELGAGNWQMALSVTLTNDPQIVALPRPGGGMTFWRVKAK